MSIKGSITKCNNKICSLPDQIEPNVNHDFNELIIQHTYGNQKPILIDKPLIINQTIVEFITDNNKSLKSPRDKNINIDKIKTSNKSDNIIDCLINNNIQSKEVIDINFKKLLYLKYEKEVQLYKIINDIYYYLYLLNVKIAYIYKWISDDVPTQGFRESLISREPNQSLLDIVEIYFNTIDKVDLFRDLEYKILHMNSKYELNGKNLGESDPISDKCDFTEKIASNLTDGIYKLQNNLNNYLYNISYKENNN